MITRSIRKTGLLLRLFILLTFAAFFTSAKAILPTSPNTKISLLTCGAGYEVYSMYGHAALRIRDTSLNYDYVINYGIFSMGIDNFAYLFVKGETDYEVAVSSFENFMDEYIVDNREVYENEIQLSDSSKRVLIDYIEWNLQPENKVYRYKFFSDNCATRIRNILERSATISWSINQQNRIKSPSDAQFTNIVEDYWQKNTKYTFRDIILIYQAKIPWINAGIQLPIAAPADTHLTYRAAMFLPDFLMDAALNAKVIKNGKLIPLVKPTVQLLKVNPKLLPQKMPWYVMPQPVITGFFILIILLTLYGVYKKRLYRFIDSLLLFITGVIGILLVFMSFISVHECMRPNYNLCWALPINFLAFLVVIFSKQLLLKYYHFLFIVYSIFILLLPFVPQSIPFIHMVFPLLIMLRYIGYVSVKKMKQ